MTKARYDAPLISGKAVYGMSSLGVLGSVIRATTGPSSGPNGAGLLYNDWDSGDDGKEFRALIVTPPSSGVFTAYEDGSFSLTGAADGTYSVVYRLFVDGVDQGLANGSITIGAGAVIAARASVLGIRANGAILSLKPLAGGRMAITGTGEIVALVGSPVSVGIDSAGKLVALV